MHQVNLKAKKRSTTGKNSNRKSRSKGMVPGVVYGKGLQNILIEVDAGELQRTLTTKAGARVIIDLEIDGEGKTEKVTTMATEVQKDIYKKKYYHVDFHKIALDEKVQTEVPVVLIGEAKGVKAGGMLDHLLWTVPVKALPLDLPEKIEIDITNLEQNDSIAVKDLPVSKNVEILLEPDEDIAIVHPPRVAETPATEGAAAAVPAAV